MRLPSVTATHKMAFDVVAACDTASAHSNIESFLIGLVVLFALYIGLDVVAAVLLIVDKMKKQA